MGPGVPMGRAGVRGVAFQAAPAGGSPGPASGPRGESGPAADRNEGPSGSDGSSLQTVDRVRTQFIETWMWTDGVAGYWLPWEPKYNL